MLGLFGKKPGSLLGIDIAATSVRLLALSRQGRAHQVEAYACEPRAVGREQPDSEALAAVLSRAWRHSGSRLKAVAVALPGEALIDKLIEVPAGLSGAELELQVELEAAQHIPYPLEDAAMDFAVLGPLPDNPSRMQLLLVACRNEDVEALETSLAQAGLEPQVVDSEILALERCLAMLVPQLSLAPHCALALLDIGEDVSQFRVMHELQLIYGREQLFGSRQLAQALERDCSLTLDQAVLAERRNLLPQSCLEQVLQSFEEQLLQHLHRALQLFAESPQRRSIELLLLAGAGSRLAGLAQRVAARVGIATVIADPFVGMSVADQVDAEALAHQAPNLLLACGLALRGFD
ncbi:type IV pilus assembly protein PilM [Pseudomonas sp. NFXW11]|uniref:type IV pilus assembly protein PilM n=1 Tax=Pseudomonas sp. NFXW11 TaxID=2819531 RepID=UPI003CEA97C0